MIHKKLRLLLSLVSRITRFDVPRWPIILFLLSQAQPKSQHHCATMLSMIFRYTSVPILYVQHSIKTKESMISDPINDLMAQTKLKAGHQEIEDEYKAYCALPSPADISHLFEY